MSKGAIKQRLPFMGLIRLKKIPSGVSSIIPGMIITM